MITLLGTLIGFISSLFPEVSKQVQDRRDKAHELKLLELQMQQATTQSMHRADEIDAGYDAATSNALYSTWKTDIGWVDALNGTVRPVIAYAFFLLYACVKLMQFHALDVIAPLPWQLSALWAEEDQAIFAGIIAFYFGSRGMKKARES
jgi:hypothetical protein